MSKNRFSKKINDYYTDLDTGRKYYAPTGVTLRKMTWVVSRVGKIKRPRICFHFSDYDLAMEYLKTGDQSVIHRREFKEHSNKMIKTGHTSINIEIRQQKNGYSFRLRYRLTPGPNSICLKGSTITLDRIEDYSLEMHRPFIEKALKIIEVHKSTT